MQLSADTLQLTRDYPNFPEFEEYGIDMSKIDVTLIFALQQFRSSTGISMVPSPVKGGIIRENDRTSRHSTDGRLSDAADVFPDPERFYETLIQAYNFKMFGGVGFYPNTEPSPMLHLDCRPFKGTGFKTVWCRKNGKYYYPSMSEFWEILKEVSQ